MDKLRIMSYNPTGLGSRRPEYIKSVLDRFKIDILFLQETWLLPSNLYKLGEIHEDYLFHGQSGITDGELLQGRPYGGVAILWHKKLASNVQKVKNCDSKRICAVKLSCQQKDILLVSCYMPNDNYHKRKVSDEFINVCDTLECMISKNNDCDIIVGGDMNLDYKRNNAHDNYFAYLLENCDMLDCWTIESAKCDYTYCDYLFNTSCIDRFSISSCLKQFVRNTYPIDCALNLSNHRPVLMSLDIAVSVTKYSAGAVNDCTRLIAWQCIDQCHPSVATYKQHLDMLLNSSTNYGVKQCKDFLCVNLDHKMQIDKLCNFLIDCCLKADQAFPRKKRGQRVIPGWTEHVKDYRDECLLWFDIWKCHGKPADGLVFESMKESKRQYIYAVRRTKRKETAIRNQRMAADLCRNKDRDFFKEVKKLCSKTLIAPSINSLTDPADIASCFSEKYQTLYNSVPSDPQVIASIEDDVQIKLASVDQDFSITKLDVLKAVKQLKPAKHDGHMGFNSSHLLYATDTLFTLLAQLIESCIIHSYQPQCLTLSTVVSIPKDYREDLCNDSNYRGITLCSSLVKVFDLVMMSRNQDVLQTSQNQFAYKASPGTVLCTLMLKEIVTHYTRNGSDVYSCFIDASKAFDCIKHDQLFSILLNRGMHPLDLRFLMVCYKQQRMRTTWGGAFSQAFGTTNGIGQGKMASPILFCCYLDVLLNRLADLGVGCWMGAHFAGTIAYADDLTLLSPTAAGLQDMIKICEQFSKEFAVTYNPKKSVCVLFSKRQKVTPSISLNGQDLHWNSKVKHLGNVLSYNMDEGLDVSLKRGDLASRVNKLMGSLQGASSDVLMKVFSSKCCHFYGSSAWRLRDNNIKDFETMYNRSVRRVLHLPYRTHTRLLPLLTGKANAMEEICARFVKMLYAASEGDNKLVRYITKEAMTRATSIAGSNMLFIKRNYGLDAREIRCYNFRRHHLKIATNHEQCTAQAIRDLRGDLVDFHPFQAEALFELCVM